MTWEAHEHLQFATATTQLPQTVLHVRVVTRGMLTALARRHDSGKPEGDIKRAALHQ